jgi:phosphoglycerol transferase
MNNYLLLTVSIALFFTGVIFHGNRRAMLGSVISTLFLLYSIVFIVSDYFTGSGVDSSVFFHLRYGLDGAGFGDYLIGDFVKRISASEYAENTVIVVLSDHLAMQNTASEILSKGARRGLFLVITPEDDFSVIDKEGSTLDVAPTVLSFLGYEAEVGLGRSLLDNEKSLVAQFADFDSVLKGWRKPLSSFWRFPRLNRDDRIVINPSFKTVTVHGRGFKYPVLIELHADMEAVMKFDFDNSSGHKLLSDHRDALAEGSPFLWVDRCPSMELEHISLVDGYCLEYGVAGSRYNTTSNVYGIMNVSVNDILGPAERQKN